MQNLPKINRGFTLIEVLIVMAILSILTTLGYFVAIDFYKSYAFNSERDIIVSILQKARSQSLSNINQSAHGVYFDNLNSRYVIFQGVTYAARNAALDENLAYAPGINHSGLVEISFFQLSGDSSASGSMNLSDGKRNTTISVNSEGQINW